jgi:hypothetical protein
MISSISRVDIYLGLILVNRPLDVCVMQFRELLLTGCFVLLTLLSLILSTIVKK